MKNRNRSIVPLALALMLAAAPAAAKRPCEPAQSGCQVVSLSDMLEVLTLGEVVRVTLIDSEVAVGFLEGVSGRELWLGARRQLGGPAEPAPPREEILWTRIASVEVTRERTGRARAGKIAGGWMGFAGSVGLLSAAHGTSGVLLLAAIPALPVFTATGARLGAKWLGKPQLVKYVLEARAAPAPAPGKETAAGETVNSSLTR